MFRHPFSFKGRIRRLEYALSLLLYLALLVPLNLLLPDEHAPDTTTGTLAGILALFIVPPSLWFMLAQGAKRCHDRNGTGFFLLIPYYLLWLLFAPGTRGPNDYGPDPKSPADSAPPAAPDTAGDQ